LVGIINHYSKPLSSFTLAGTASGYGIFEITQNGICLYTNTSYCASAISGYEGPTTTFSNLMSQNFLTYKGTVNVNPTLYTGQTNYFAIQNNPADIIANGGLTVTGETFSGEVSTTPEPSAFLLAGFGVALLCSWRLRSELQDHQRRIASGESRGRGSPGIMFCVSGYADGLPSSAIRRILSSVICRSSSPSRCVVEASTLLTSASILRKRMPAELL
jgi:hypothetical protein